MTFHTDSAQSPRPWPRSSALPFRKAPGVSTEQMTGRWNFRPVSSVRRALRVSGDGMPKLRRMFSFVSAPFALGNDRDRCARPNDAIPPMIATLSPPGQSPWNSINPGNAPEYNPLRPAGLFPRFLHTIPGRRISADSPTPSLLFLPKRFFLSVPGSSVFSVYFTTSAFTLSACQSLLSLRFFRFLPAQNSSSNRHRPMPYLPPHFPAIHRISHSTSFASSLGRSDPQTHAPPETPPAGTHRRFLSYCLLNNPRSRKPNQRATPPNNIPQHRPARRHAARRRVRQHTPLKAPHHCVFQRRRRLRHLHQRNNPSCIRASRARKQNHRQRNCRPLHRPRNLLPNSYSAHTGHHKPAITDPDHRLHPV